MAEENELQEQQEQEQGNKQYIEAINKLKSETVSKDRYNKLLEENKNLLDSLVNGKEVAAAEQPVQKKDLNELRKELFHPEKELNDIQYVEKALELRDRVLEETGEDCFVGRGVKYVPSEGAYESAERTAKVFKECLEYANGDNAVFINELQRRTNDIPLPKRKK